MERKNRPAGAEGQAQEKEGPKRPSIYELEKVMIGVFMCVCVCVCACVRVLEAGW